MFSILFTLTGLTVYGIGFWTTFFIFARKQGFFGRLFTSAIWPLALAAKMFGVV